MEARIPTRLLSLLGFSALLIISHHQIEKRYTPPFPPYRDLINTVGENFQDAAFITLGFRALAADVAWIQLLQSMGQYGETETTDKNYPFLKESTLRVMRIDPSFRSATLFGAATLGWLRTINRPEEAMELLEEGIRYNPHFWPFRTYAAGIGYMKTNQRQKMIRMLEEALKDPECPTTVKSILANTYKAENRYREAIILWADILSSDKGRDYHIRAREEISILTEFLKKNRS